MIKFLILPEGEDPDTLIKHESPKSFTKRIEEAQTLSSFLFDHIKSEVPFETIEGKTLFLEQSALLIHQVSYPIYRQQLIEGVAQTIRQDVSYVEKALNQSVLSKPPTFDRSVNEINDFTDTSLNDFINVKVSPNLKGLMSKMITCIINYPSLVNDPESSGVIEERAKKIPKSDVLMELIHSAQIEPDITKEALIKPYENKNNIFLRLKKLSVMEPFLSENEAKIEFMSALTAAENHQQRKTTKASILSAKTKAQEKEIVDDISRRKLSSGYKKS